MLEVLALIPEITDQTLREFGHDKNLLTKTKNAVLSRFGYLSESQFLSEL